MIDVVDFLTVVKVIHAELVKIYFELVKIYFELVRIYAELVETYVGLVVIFVGLKVMTGAAEMMLVIYFEVMAETYGDVVVICVHEVVIRVDEVVICVYVGKHYYGALQETDAIMNPVLMVICSLLKKYRLEKVIYLLTYLVKCCQCYSHYNVVHHVLLEN